MKNYTPFTTCPALASACGLFLAVHSGFAQGSLTPPGAPAPTMKTLAQVEPRMPISTATNITVSGSYYLTTNLNITSGNAIQITANNVTLDLNGFALLGNGTDGYGVYIPDAQTNITVRNGAISGWEYYGVYSASVSSTSQAFERLNVSACYDGFILNGSVVMRDCNCQDCSFTGIDCGGACQVSGCTAYNNGTDGIVAGSGIVSGCTVEGNGYSGIIMTQNGYTVKDCVAMGNSEGGIVGQSEGLITGCTVTGNGGDGIETGNVCKVADCVAEGSTIYGIYTSDHCQVTGCHVSGNTYAGIVIADYSVVRENVVDDQAGTTTTAGISMSGTLNRIEANQITRCGIGVQATGTGNLIIRNNVGGSTGVAYSIVAANNVGVIIQPTSSAAISGSSGGGIGSTDPTANFAH